MKDDLRLIDDDPARPWRRAPKKAAPDLGEQYETIVEDLRSAVRGLRQQLDRYARTYQKLTAADGSSEEAAAAFRRLKQLELVANHIESSAAYLVGSGLAPAAAAEERDERIEFAQRVLDSLEAERERLYRDVHDGPAQALANAIFEIEYLERLADRPGEERTVRAELAALRERFRGSLEQVRAMILDLRPPVLTELGLAGALRSYANEFGSRTGIAVECVLEATDTGLAPQQELAVYRVMQEALQNVHKHAHAPTVRISWERQRDRWVLRCVDDGVGFDLVKAARRRRSVGLLSMRERAELIGGQLDIRSAPEQGTAVALILPVVTEGATR